VSELETELRAALDLLLIEAWNSEQAAMGNPILLTLCDKLNIMASTHIRKLHWYELNQRDVIDKLEEILRERMYARLNRSNSSVIMPIRVFWV
jgi:hypothetical protein